MSLAAEVRGMTRLALGLRSFLRERVTLDEACAIVRRRLDEREKNFLSLVEHAIFGYADSPYRPLFAQAQCTIADVREMTRARGVEATLGALRDRGVYVTFEEFKGRQPILRDGREFAVGPRAFQNPLVDAHYWTETGGTTGRPSRVGVDLSLLRSIAPYRVIADQAHGTKGAPKAMWRDMLPASAGLSHLLMTTLTGEVPERWFVPLAPRDLKSSRKYPAATYAIVGLGRALGTPLPWPEHVPLEQALVVARWAADTARTRGRAHVNTSASMALRVCLAARDAGLRLDRVTLSGGSEPMTAAKARAIRETGAEVWPSYYTTEAGALGMCCGHPVDPGDMHFLADSSALVQAPQAVPGTAIHVDGFYLTSLLPSAPNIMLNVQLDDYGVVETRSCGCLFEEVGLTTHVRSIRSSNKLSGGGVTLIGSDMERILEDVLPQRFGGTPLDYQLSEEEDREGVTRLILVVSPRVELEHEASVIDVVLQALSRQGPAAEHVRASWAHAGTFRIVRREPVWTDRGKLMPLHLERAGRVRPDPAGSTTPER